MSRDQQKLAWSASLVAVANLPALATMEADRKKQRWGSGTCPLLLRPSLATQLAAATFDVCLSLAISLLAKDLDWYLVRMAWT